MKILSSLYLVNTKDILFDDIFSSLLAYTSQSYSEAMAMLPSVIYTPYNTYSKEQTGDILTFAYFEEEGLLSENCEYK